MTHTLVGKNSFFTGSVMDKKTEISEQSSIDNSSLSNTASLYSQNRNDRRKKENCDSCDTYSFFYLTVG
jgi:hypothetical protein